MLHNINLHMLCSPVKTSSVNNIYFYYVDSQISCWTTRNWHVFWLSLNTNEKIGIPDYCTDMESISISNLPLWISDNWFFTWFSVFSEEIRYKQEISWYFLRDLLCFLKMENAFCLDSHLTTTLVKFLRLRTKIIKFFTQKVSLNL